MLQDTFLKLLTNYTADTRLMNELWMEIELHYSTKNRHYHTLSHLNNLLQQLIEVKGNIEHWETILFTLYYHDSIYKASKSDNEEQSADLAEKRMKQCGVPMRIIDDSKAQILATKKHLYHTESDTNYFTDADLSVLGLDWESYSAYFQHVRKEYAIYPNLIYNPGRKKVLKHFLDMERIYKTDYFYTKFEVQAKLNVQRELEML